MNVTRQTLNARMAVTHEWDKLQFITGIDSQKNKHGKGMYSATMPINEFPCNNRYGISILWWFW